MPTTYTRADIGLVPPKPGPGPLDPANVNGIVLHWPGMSTPRHGFAAVSRALRAWQRYHMGTNGWSDIAYQVAVDQDGNEYELRGLRVQSGANGNQDLNRRFVAVLLVLAPGEKPTQAMKRAVRRIVRRSREMYPRARLILGHGDVRPGGTACPGPIVTGLIIRGAFEPRTWTRGKRVDNLIKRAQRVLHTSRGAKRRAGLRAAVRELKAIPRRRK